MQVLLRKQDFKWDFGVNGTWLENIVRGFELVLITRVRLVVKVFPVLMFKNLLQGIH